jgi:hypothetical protein
MVQLAGYRAARRAPAEAEQIAREALKRRVEIAGSNDAWTCGLARHVASVLRESGRLEQAESLARETRETVGLRLGRLHPEYAAVTAEVALILMEQGRPAEAASVLRLTLTELQSLPEKNVGRIFLSGLLGASLASEPSARQEARERLRSSLDVLVMIAGETDERARELRRRLDDSP